MERDEFRRRFVAAYTRARDFAREYIEEPLPDAVRFRVELNASYDGHADETVRLYPEDSAPERRAELADVDAETAFAALYRDGRIPEWINVSVEDATDAHTIVELTVCGRFTDDDARLYHQQEGRPPFHVLGPALPPEYEEGVRFSLHLRKACASLEELERIRRHASKVQTLRLEGSDFAEDQLDGLGFENLTHLTLSHTQVRRLDALADVPRLSFVWVTCGDIPSFVLTPRRALPNVEWLVLRDLPNALDDVRGFRAAMPRLADLELASAHDLETSGPIDLTGLGRVSLSAPVVPRGVERCTGVRDLTVAFAEIDEARFIALLTSAAETLERLFIDETPISEATLGAVARLPRLRRFRTRGTGLDTSTLEEFAHAHPHLGPRRRS
ncbi:MAG: hypothetical protein RMA76_27580 [Deltaproteobacteria bacterium]